MNRLYENMQTSVFERMSGLAARHGAVNLGQGFPDFGWPDDVLLKAAEALTGAASQYPPMRGLAELREAVAAHYNRHQDLALTAEQVIVTSGATEAIAASLLALIAPGDEVVLFQPLYDAYLPLVLRAGGVPRLVRLTPPDWRITEAGLAEAFSPNTRLVFQAYDFAIPDGRGICNLGPWLKPTFDLRGFPNRQAAFEVVQEMLKRFAAMLAAIEAAHPTSVTFINGQGTLAPQTSSWHNELHPARNGFEKFADLFYGRLKALFPERVA